MDDLRFSQRRYGNIEEDQRDLSVGFLMKKRKNFDLSTRDADYVMYVNGDISILCHPPHELSVENGGDDDPQYKLFFSRLRKNGSSYILKADETIGLAKPFKYEQEDDFDGDYAFFWRNLRFSGDNMCFQHGSDHSVMYDGRLLQILQNMIKIMVSFCKVLQNMIKMMVSFCKILQNMIIMMVCFCKVLQKMIKMMVNLPVSKCLSFPYTEKNPILL